MVSAIFCNRVSGASPFNGRAWTAGFVSVSCTCIRKAYFRLSVWRTVAFLPEGAVEQRVYFPLRACAVRPDVVAAGEEGRAETGG